MPAGAPVLRGRLEVFEEPDVEAAAVLPKGETPAVGGGNRPAQVHVVLAEHKFAIAVQVDVQQNGLAKLRAADPKAFAVGSPVDEVDSMTITDWDGSNTGIGERDKLELRFALGAVQSRQGKGASVGRKTPVGFVVKSRKSVGVDFVAYALHRIEIEEG